MEGHGDCTEVREVGGLRALTTVLLMVSARITLSFCSAEQRANLMSLFKLRHSVRLGAPLPNAPPPNARGAAALARASAGASAAAAAGPLALGSTSPVSPLGRGRLCSRSATSPSTSNTASAPSRPAA